MKKLIIAIIALGLLATAANAYIHSGPGGGGPSQSPLPLGLI